MHRRALLGGLLGLVACKHAPPMPLSAFTGRVALGWGLLPGHELSLSCRTTRDQPRMRVSVIERWRLRVVDVDARDVASLEGWRTGLGGEAIPTASGAPKPDAEAALEALRAEPARVALRLGLDGRLLSPSSGPPTWPTSAFALRLPVFGAAIYDEWADPELAASLAALIGGQLPTQAEGRTRLLDVSGTTDAPFATLGTRLRVRTGPGSPALSAEGTALWNLHTHRLASRRLALRYAPQPTDPERAPGALTVELALS